MCVQKRVRVSKVLKLLEVYFKCAIDSFAMYCHVFMGAFFEYIQCPLLDTLILLLFLEVT